MPLQSSQGKRSLIVGDNGRTDPASILRSILAKLKHLDLTGKLQYEAIMKGHGGYADVFVGFATTQRWGEMKVAVKRLRIHILGESGFAKSLVKEIRVWSRLDHPNVLTFLGYALEGDDYPLLISEWMENGTAKTYMNEHPGYDVAQMLLGVASGLAYLHEQGVIHGDMKADNVLINNVGQPQICDFGISSIVATSTTLGITSSNSHGARGSSRWMAIELLVATETVLHSKETDVWAFGMTAYELITNQLPYAHLKLEPQVLIAIIQGVLPLQPNFATLSRHAPESKIWDLCCMCWQRDPRERPVMRSVIQTLAAIQKSYSAVAARGVGFKTPPRIVAAVQLSVKKSVRFELPLQDPPENIGVGQGGRDEIDTAPSDDHSIGRMIPYELQPSSSNMISDLGMVARDQPPVGPRVSSEERRRVRFRLPSPAPESPVSHNSSIPSEDDLSSVRAVYAQTVYADEDMEPSMNLIGYTHAILSGSPFIFLDLSSNSFKPVTPARDSSLVDIHRVYLEQPACSSPDFPPWHCEKMSIRCSALEPFADAWRIAIEPGRIINVNDVLYSVYTALQMPITQREWELLRTDDQLKVNRAYATRVRKGAPNPGYAWMALRSDLLGDRCWFERITATVEVEYPYDDSAVQIFELQTTESLHRENCISVITTCIPICVEYVDISTTAMDI